MAVARTRSRFDREDAGPRNDVYTGLLTISLVAMISDRIIRAWCERQQARIRR